MKVPIDKIKPNKDNPRYIKDDAYKKLIQSIKEFPEMAEVRELVVNKDMVILGGNMRFKAMVEAGWQEVPVRVVDWSEDKQREFVIKDNVSGGEWDWDLLANSWDIEDLEAWGLDTPDSWHEPEEIEEDEAPEVTEDPVSELGKIYQLGRHRVMCGDSINLEDADKLMGKQKAEMAFTDPPYLMGFEGNVHADGSKSFNAKHGAIKNDKMTREDGDDFIYAMFETLKMYTDGAYYVCFYRLGLEYIFRALDGLDNKYRALIIWDKGNHTLSNSDYMSKYEPIVYGWFNKHNFYGGRSNFDIWNIDRTAKNELHPTMKPIELCAKAIQNSSKKDNIVLDLFLGSGSTLIACEQTDRTCYGMELDPKYVDVIRKRYAKFIQPDNQLPDNWEELTPEIDCEV